MGLYQNTKDGLRYRRWTQRETFAYFCKGVARELKIAPAFFEKCYEDVVFSTFKKRWLKKSEGESYFDFNGIKFPDISGNREKLRCLTWVFEDTFMFSCYLNDNYNKDTVEFYDRYMGEGPYGYTDGDFDVTVKKGDIVIDAGAWMGDFSAYAASKGAITYAFEPTAETFRYLRETEKMYNNHPAKGKIHPIQKGLGNSEGEIAISIECISSGGNSIMAERQNSDITEKIAITTLDKFVEETKLDKVDFIKADIEGAEREMLKGASNVLKTFAPKLAICTYHFPDDSEVLAKIILEANPNYTIVQLRHKLMAMVVEKKQ